MNQNGNCKIDLIIKLKRLLLILHNLLSKSIYRIMEFKICDQIQRRTDYPRDFEQNLILK